MWSLRNYAQLTPCPQMWPGSQKNNVHELPLKCAKCTRAKLVYRGRNGCVTSSHLMLVCKAEPKHPRPKPVSDQKGRSEKSTSTNTALSSLEQSWSECDPSGWKERHAQKSSSISTISCSALSMDSHSANVSLALSLNKSSIGKEIE